MILADKIINERKKNGWSQEELAEKLSVSRQSVSKWDGAQAVPDLQRIIRMAELFDVSTDYLLKDEIELSEKSAAQVVDVEAVPPIRKVSMEEAVTYLSFMETYAVRVANAVSMCIVSPVVLLLLGGLAEEERFGISENLAGGIGIVALFLLICVAVYTFVTFGLRAKKYEYLDAEQIETEYGVSGMVKEKGRNYENKYTTAIVAGVILCIVSPLPLIIMSLADAADYLIVIMVCLLLGIVAAAVNLFVRSDSIRGSYDKLLQEGEFIVAEKKAAKRTSKVASVYWGIVTAFYLAWSFITMHWESTWIVWPVAGVLFGVVITIAKSILKEE